MLTRDPASRPAALGLARVARSENRLDDARGLYQRLLAVNPQDPDALNGMAWLALAERNREQARAGFEHVLSIAPGNEEAKLGLSKTVGVPVAAVPSGAGSGQNCEIDEAQRLFGQQPRPTATVKGLLADCVAAGSTDYRIYMLMGVMARDAGDREHAIAYLSNAHEIAPLEPNPALELGFTLEAQHPREARKVYEQILARDPASRPAALGLARVARSQNNLDEARGLYQRLLAVNPNDPEALNGMAWLALAEHNREQARAGFEHVLTIAPDNEEAKIGLSKSQGVLVSAVRSRASSRKKCEIDEAQRLFGQQPRPTATVESLLAACIAAGSTDYRIYALRGVMAREAGDRGLAIAYLSKAHEIAPLEPNPALELGFTLEAQHPREARKLYEQILARDHASRPAALGLARVARSENRLDDARGLYERLLAVNPKDPDALNGMAWLALAERNREEARAGFEHVLTIAPGNEEAKLGLSKTPDVYRYLLDTTATSVSTSQGSSWGFGARGEAGITAFDTLEAGWYHFTNELQTVSETGVATLPSDDITVGYHRLVPLSYGVSLYYDYRGHDDLPTEHWIGGSIDFYLTDSLRWFGGYRQAFGAFQYNGRLIQTGLSAKIAPSWEVTGTVYDSAQAIFNNYQNLWTGVVDVTYYGPRSLLLVGGVGYSPLIDNLDLHARAILPVTDRIALQLIAAHNSTNDDTRATAGLRVTW
jgi:tetratricopeptide (TPR) repeat protein